MLKIFTGLAPGFGLKSSAWPESLKTTFKLHVSALSGLW